MRLWHKDLIPFLPRQQLVGQWRELCAIARNIDDYGTPNHVLVNKIIDYPKDDLITYAQAVYMEMTNRGYDAHWVRFAGPMRWLDPVKAVKDIYNGWHNERYLHQCLANLQEKADCGAIPAEEWERITDRWPEYK